MAFGEKTVLRILNPEIMFQNLDGLGFSRRDRAVYNGFMSAPNGLVFVTGPTGSGKSTTLYSTLKQVATPEKNIVTVEDPVEMVYEEFNQIAVVLVRRLLGGALEVHARRAHELGDDDASLDRKSVV